jgi:hypothetical protein
MNTELQSEERKETPAAEADGRIKGGAHWNDWMYIADGFAVGVAKAMRGANTNRPYGKAYTRLFGEWLQERPWAKRYDKGTRSNLLWCADHRSEIEEWRSGLAQNERDKLNHPTNFRRKFEAAHRKAEAPDEPKKETAKDSLVRENEELWAKLKGMEAERDEVRAAYEANKDVIEDTLSALLRKDAETIGDTIVRQLVGDGRSEILVAVWRAVSLATAKHAPKHAQKIITYMAQNEKLKSKTVKVTKQATGEEPGGFAPGVKEHLTSEAEKAAKRKTKATKQAAE